eukprot:TRINITY_DN61097_c0_g1_i1.p1 TRINITY_DN61097_c0_g1~~TRINITY_DN61097_c0_g1_i1.p1  ORF type:complete len:1008 (+),score=170.89 TRINITY_DN61097_c0_g1_i1:198-3026(+)
MDARATQQRQSPREDQAALLPTPEDTRLSHVAKASASDSASDTAIGDVSMFKYAKFFATGFVGVKHAVFIADDDKFHKGTVERIFSSLGIEFPPCFVVGSSGSCHPSDMLNKVECRYRRLRSLVGKEPMDTFGNQASESQMTCMINKIQAEKILAVMDSTVQTLEEVGAATVHCGPQLTSFDVLFNETKKRRSSSMTSISMMHINDEAVRDPRADAIIKTLLRAASNSSMHEGCAENVEPVFLDAAWAADCVSLENPWNCDEDSINVGSPTHVDAKKVSASQFCFLGANVFFFFYRRGSDGSFDASKTLSSSEMGSILERKSGLPLPTLRIFVGGRSADVLSAFLDAVRTLAPVLIVGRAGGLSAIFAHATLRLGEIAAGDIAKLEAVSKRGRRLTRAEKASFDEYDRLDDVDPAKLLSSILQSGEVDQNDIVEITKDHMSTMIAASMKDPRQFFKNILVVDPLLSTKSEIVQAASDVIAVTVSRDLSSPASSQLGDQPKRHKSEDRSIIAAWLLYHYVEAKAKYYRKIYAFIDIFGSAFMWATIVASYFVTDDECCLVGCLFGGSVQEPPAGAKSFLVVKNDGESSMHSINVSTPLLLPTSLFPDSVRKDEAVCAARAFSGSEDIFPWLLPKLVILIPILAALATRSTSHIVLDLRNRLMSVAVASETILSHIYQFRASVGVYSGSTSEKVFSSRIQSIMANDEVSRTVGDYFDIDGIIQGAKWKGHKDERAATDIMRSAIVEQPKPRNAEWKQFWKCFMEFGSLTERHQASMDDGISPLSADAYFTSRVGVLKERYTAEAACAQWPYTWAQICIVIGGCIASLFAAFGYYMELILAMSFTLMMDRIMLAQNWTGVMRSTNAALMGLMSAEMQWETMSINERHAPSAKESFVTRLEAQHMRLVQATTFATMTRMIQPKDGPRATVFGQSAKEYIQGLVAEK